jgi:glycosyltransferase involved in cell wall biosynthesis
MKVILSTEVIRFPLTGIGRYTFELGQHLSKSPAIETLVFFNGRHLSQRLPAPEMVNLQIDHKSMKYQLKQWVQNSEILSEIYRLNLLLLQQQKLKSHSEFIYHGPNFYLPRFKGKKVATFHDLSPYYPGYHKPIHAKYLQKRFAYTLKHADALITDSEYVKQEIISKFDWPSNRIFSIPLAAGKEFFPRKASNVQFILNKYHLSFQGYALYVGTIEPRKNILTMLKAYRNLPPAVRKKWPIVLSGYEGWESEEIHDGMQQAQVEGWAIYLGYVPAEDLPILFSGAQLFIFPSYYEGFGLPVLEAMQSGVPVVCSNASSLPEVIGDCGLMCDPNDADTMQKLILKGLEDQPWRNQAIDKGIIRSEGFSWSRCAHETALAYEKILNMD